MDEKQSTFPPIHQVIFILFLTFFLFSILVVLWDGHWGKWGLWLVEAGTIVPALVFLRNKPYSYKTIFRLKPVSMPVLFISAVIGGGLSLVTEEIDRLIQYIFPMPESLWNSLADSMTCQSTTDWIVLVMAVVVTAALVEEMLFRGLLQGALEQRIDVTRSVIVTAVVFTIIHYNPWWAVEILLLGMLMGVMAWKSQSIFPGVVVHGINNGLALLLINLPESSYQFLFFRKHVAPWWLLLGLTCVVGGFWFFYQLFDRENDGYDNSRSSEEFES